MICIFVTALVIAPACAPPLALQLLVVPLQALQVLVRVTAAHTLSEEEREEAIGKKHSFKAAFSQSSSNRSEQQHLIRAAAPDQSSST